MSDNTLSLRKVVVDSPEQLSMEFTFKRIRKKRRALSHEKPYGDEAKTWTNDEIISLHLATLEDVFSQVTNIHTSKKVFDDAVQWVSEPVSDRRALRPFSFAACCKVAGYDYEELRDLFLEQLTNPQ